MTFHRPILLLIVVLAISQRGHGHEVASVEFGFERRDDQWTLTGQMDVAYMLPETRNLPGLNPLSRNEVMQYSPEKWARVRSDTESFLRGLLVLRFNGAVVPWRIQFPDFETTPPDLPRELGDPALMTTRIVVEPIRGPGVLRACWAEGESSELIVTVEDGEEIVVLSASGGKDIILWSSPASGPDPATSGSISRPLAGGLIRSGFHHVLSWSDAVGWRRYVPPGLDHILFMLGLFLLLPRWKPLMCQSLLFTVSHSLTLSLAVLDVISLPSRLVEILIAASISWIGIENLFIKSLTRRRFVLIFGFGLLHGMGFANGLKEKLGNLPHGGLIVPILGFNTGVELAQIVILGSALLALQFLRKWTNQVRILGSVLVGGAGLFWMVERLTST